MKVTYQCDNCQKTFDNRQECLRHEVEHITSVEEVLRIIQRYCCSKPKCYDNVDLVPLCPFCHIDRENDVIESRCLLRANPQAWDIDKMFGKNRS